ncbi:hypothetical protein J6590_023414 [Homalodisca vitripennis]|nr:hypothetical protein J6590_023414 [Homalodisca vitripennis]
MNHVVDNPPVRQRTQHFHHVCEKCESVSAQSARYINININTTPSAVHSPLDRSLLHARTQGCAHRHRSYSRVLPWGGAQISGAMF